jgi:hypothetical protein
MPEIKFRELLFLGTSVHREEKRVSKGHGYS